MLTFHATEQINEVSRTTRRTTRTRTTTQVITRYFGRWPQTKNGGQLCKWEYSPVVNIINNLRS